MWLKLPIYSNEKQLKTRKIQCRKLSEDLKREKSFDFVTLTRKINIKGP